ncbi:MAG TPA: hypothetical protein VFA12_05880 [Stellaceae bacterium]|nr:hypothetical protein [Stellaceae bacterium]
MAERYLKTLAARLLARYGVAVIWDLHVRAAALYRRGNWAAALAMIGIADAAEQRLSRPREPLPPPAAGGTWHRRHLLRQRFQRNGGLLGRRWRRDKRRK